MTSLRNLVAILALSLLSFHTLAEIFIDPKENKKRQ